MEWQEKEAIIFNFIDITFQQIISENPSLPIRAVSRASAEISDILEDYFVDIAKQE